MMRWYRGEVALYTSCGTVRSSIVASLGDLFSTTLLYRLVVEYFD